jgi:NAD(P)-dependent dehydrogenase (short-subunit alcohol dehydrogenase family)
MNLFGLEGRVALVTGAAQGIGLAIARALAHHGAAVIVSDRHAARCEEVASTLRASGAQAVAMTADLAQEDQVAALGRAALAWQGRLHVLVSNAGIQGPAGPLSSVTNEDWLQVMETNLHAVFGLTNCIVPHMAEYGGGSVILMSSIAGLRGNKAIGLYGMSKAAVAQLARNLAVEWGPLGVRVNAVSPGLIRSPLSHGLIADDAFVSRRLQATPLRRVGEPEEVAGVVVMLASAAGAFVSGHNLVVDGGTTISDGN